MEQESTTINDDREALEMFENAFYQYKQSQSTTDIDYQPGQRMFQTMVVKPRPSVIGDHFYESSKQ